MISVVLALVPFVVTLTAILGFRVKTHRAGLHPYIDLVPFMSMFATTLLGTELTSTTFFTPLRVRALTPFPDAGSSI